MQTFLPYPGFAASAAVLDSRRLGKQRVETFQILRALTWPSYAWKNHPAVRMWRGFVPALVAYGVAVCDEWRGRGGSDTVRESLLQFTGGVVPELARLRAGGQLPGWLGLTELHLSHRSALLRKEPEFYRPYFPDVPDDLPYVWPADAFPRWPVRRGAEPLTALGHEDFRAGQRGAVESVAAGSDVLLCMPPGAGATTTGLFAGLTRPRPTLWLSERSGDADPLGAGPVAPAVAGRPASPEGTAAPGQGARPPGPEEIAAMTEEIEAAQLPNFVFHAPARLAAAPVRQELARLPPGLIVLDDVDLGTPPTPRLPESAAPILVLSRGGPPQLRQAAIDRLGLRRPVVVGGGWDRPGMRLVAYTDRSEVARRRRLIDLLDRQEGTTLALTTDDAAARNVAAALVRAGVEAAAVGPRMRPATVTDRLLAARRGRLTAVVTPGPSLQDMLALAPPRLHFGSIAVLDLPVTAADLHSYLLPGAAQTAVLVRQAEASSASALTDWLWHGRCRWADLLDRFGEAISVPCGRCDLCEQLLRKGST